MKHFNKGAFNIVLKVIFDDGVQWVIRIQVPEVLLFNAKQRAAHEETQRKALFSQLGSMQYVKRTTKIPVPEIHGYDFSNDNIAGAPYMFMTLVEGMSIKKWLEENTLTKEKATEFYTELAEIMWEFYCTRFDKIGELEIDEDGNATVGGFYDSRTHSAYGPFTSAHEFLTQRQQKLWEYRVLAERQQTAVVPEGFRHWNQLSREVKEVFTAWLYRKAAPYAQEEYEAAYKDVQVEASSPNMAQKPDYILFHADLSINNILVNEDLKVLAVIDWDWTASLPKSSFDPLPFDMGYETSDQFPGSLRDHDVFDHKELYYSIWSKIEMEKDPNKEFGRSLVPARMGKDSIATILNRYAWTYCIERTCMEVFEKIKEYEGEDSTCWCCLIEAFRKDWETTKGSKPSWMWNLLTLLSFRS
jgi:aminoglycoside phosphotransferase (APT) family kinase protein